MGRRDGSSGQQLRGAELDPDDLITASSRGRVARRWHVMAQHAHAQHARRPPVSLRLSTRSDRHKSPRPRDGTFLGFIRPCRPAWCSPYPPFSPRPPSTVGTRRTACASTIPGQATSELEALNSIGSPPVATASEWDVLGLHPTMPASVVLAIPSIQSAAAEHGRHEPYRVRLHHPRTGHR